DMENERVRVQTRLSNAGDRSSARLTFTIREAKSGKVLLQQSTGDVVLEHENEQTVAVLISIPRFHAWSPEDPFLYQIEADTGADKFETRFGMRSFQFDPKSKMAQLNGKPYFLRGSNITLYRFFEDSQCGALPWGTNWVRVLHRKMKEMNWNIL